MNTAMPHKPSTAFIAASWVALLLGAAAYLIGLFNATMALNEKGYYLTLLLFGLFAAVSLQKSVRDRVEGIPVSGLYYALCWFALLSALLLLLVGLWNATLAPSEGSGGGTGWLPIGSEADPLHWPPLHPVRVAQRRVRRAGKTCVGAYGNPGGFGRPGFFRHHGPCILAR